MSAVATTRTVVFVASPCSIVHLMDYMRTCGPAFECSSRTGGKMHTAWRAPGPPTTQPSMTVTQPSGTALASMYMPHTPGSGRQRPARREDSMAQARKQQTLEPRTRTFYCEAVQVLKRSGVPFLVGGAYAFGLYTG